MRRALIAILCSSSIAWGAGPGELSTGAGHEVTQPATSAWNVPVRGPRFAPVTIDVWIAFGQAHATAAASAARRVVLHPQNRDVREVVHLLRQGGPPGADLASEAALEAAAQGRFFEFLDHALADRGLLLTAADLVRAGREAGLDEARLAEALETHRHLAASTELDREARAQGHGAGELFFNGARVAPYTADDDLFRHLNEARRRAQALLDDGVPLGRVYDRLMDAAADPAPVREPLPRKRLAVSLPGAPSRGSSLAPITVVVFSNFFCAACGQAALLIQRVRDAHPGQVREVWKHFYAPYAQYSNEPYAAELAVSAHAQGRFWETHDLVFSSGAARGRNLRNELDRLAREAGCDPARAQRDSRQDLLRPIVERDLLEGHKLGVVQPPALLVNGILYSTLPSFERLERQVKQELGRGLFDRLQSP